MNVADSPEPAPLPALPEIHVLISWRELQLMRLVQEGQLNKEIAHTLGLKEGTIKVYIFNLTKKLGLYNRVELAVWYTRRETQFDGAKGHVLVPAYRRTQYNSGEKINEHGR